MDLISVVSVVVTGYDITLHVDIRLLLYTYLHYLFFYSRRLSYI